MRFVVCLLSFVLLSSLSYAQVFDDKNMTPEEGRWFETQFVKGCCNLGDAYTADNYYQEDGKFFAILNDGWNYYYKRQNFPAGLKVEIPDDVWNKMRDPKTPKNPTSHGIVFMNLQGFVYCYWLPAGL